MIPSNVLPDKLIDDIREKPTFFQRPDQLHKPLYVLTSVFNATRYRSRWRAYQDFVKMVEEAGAVLYTVEVAFGERDFAVTEADNPRHLQLRTWAEVWHKENALNLLVQRLPLDWEYLAFVDADIAFARPDWADETLHKLQHFQVVQMFSEAEDLGPNFEGLQKHHSFVYSWQHKTPMPPSNGHYYTPEGPKTDYIEYHPGWCWGWRREALDAVGGQIEVGITGANDNSQARAFFGIADKSLHPDIGGTYRQTVMKWQKDALLYIQKNVGLVEGKILHFFHGKKLDRGYWTRWRVLTSTNYEPFTDLKKDWQGLFQLVVEDERQEKLRDLLHDYFVARNEDSIDVK